MNAQQALAITKKARDNIKIALEEQMQSALNHISKIVQEEAERGHDQVTIRFTAKPDAPDRSNGWIGDLFVLKYSGTFPDEIPGVNEDGHELLRRLIERGFEATIDTSKIIVVWAASE